jgi:hypothetical protein
MATWSEWKFAKKVNRILRDLVAERMRGYPEMAKIIGVDYIVG